MSFKVKLTDEEYKQYIKDMEDLNSESNYKDKNKKPHVKNQYVYFLDGTKVSYDPTLIQALEKGVHLAKSKETKERIRDEINHIKTQIIKKQFVDLGTPNKISLTTKSLNKGSLVSPTKLAIRKLFALESFNDELGDIEKHEELNPLLFEDDELKQQIKEAEKKD